MDRYGANELFNPGGRRRKKTGKAGIFAASLELTKEGNLVIKQDKLFDDIFVRKNS